MEQAGVPKRPRATTLTIVALWVVFYASFTLFTPALLDDADSVHAEVAREMLLRHDWVTLYANGIRYLEKAPLLYWTMAASMRVAQAVGAGGPRGLAVAARVPMALTVLALALAVESLARRMFGRVGTAIGRRSGLYAALVLLSSFGVFLFSRILLPDAMLCLWLTLAMLCFWRAEAIREQGSGNRDQGGTDEWSEEAPRLLCYGLAACCALGVLTKGLIGVVFPVGIEAMYLLLTRGVRGAVARLLELHPFSATAVFLAIAAPWHLLAAWENPGRGAPAAVRFVLHPAAGLGHWVVPLPTSGNVHGWAWFYFVNEQVLRYLNVRVPRDYDTVPLWLFWGLCLVWLLPWSAFVFNAVASAIRSVGKSRIIFAARAASGVSLKGTGLAVPQQDVQEEAALAAEVAVRGGAYLLLLIWGALPLLFFSFSTRQEYYVLPALPALALLIAAWLAHRARTKPRAKRHRDAAARCAAVLAGIGLCVAGVCVYLILHTQAPAPDTDLAALLQQNPSDYALSMGHFLDLNARSMGMFRWPLALTAISFGLAFPIAYLLRTLTTYAFGPIFMLVAIRKRRFKGGRIRNYVHVANLVTAAGGFGFLLAAHWGLRTFAPVLSSAELARQIVPLVTAEPDALVVIHQEYEYGSTLGFYLQRPWYVLPGVRGGQPIAVGTVHILTDPEYDGVREYGRSSNLWYGSFFPDAPEIFETRESLAAKWTGPQRIFLWQDLAGEPSPLPQMPGPVYVVARGGGKEIVSNQGEPGQLVGGAPAALQAAPVSPPTIAKSAKRKHHRRHHARRRHRRRD